MLNETIDANDLELLKQKVLKYWSQTRRGNQPNIDKFAFTKNQLNNIAARFMSRKVQCHASGCDVTRHEWQTSDGND